MVHHIIWAVAATLVAHAQAFTATWPVCPHAAEGLPAPAVAENVTGLNLSFCYLKTIKRNAFHNYQNLEFLDVSHNKIEVIHKEWFSPSLRNLDLSHNSISGEKLNSDVFDNATGLNVIRFDGNNMGGAPGDLLKMTKVEILYLNDCRLHEVPSLVNTPEPSIQLLKLTSNRISKLNVNTFTSLAALIVLDLNNNTIEWIHQDALKPLTRLLEIHLSGNKIRYLPEGVFRSSLLCSIDLSRNLIEHLPANAFRRSDGDISLKLNISENRITSLPPNFFTELSNISGAIYLQVVLKNNPWQCACLNEALIEAKKLHVFYSCTTSDSNDCSEYKGNVPVCVSNNFECYRQNVIIQYYHDYIRNSAHQGRMSNRETKKTKQLE